MHDMLQFQFATATVCRVQISTAKHTARLLTQNKTEASISQKGTMSKLQKDCLSANVGLLGMQVQHEQLSWYHAAQQVVTIAQNAAL